MDSINNYHDIDKIAKEIREFYLFLFEEIVRHRETDSAKQKNKYMHRNATDEKVRERINKMQVKRLQVIFQTNGIDCGIHAHYNLTELIRRFIEWRESANEEIRFSHFINYWSINFSCSPIQVVAKRIELYAFILKMSESYFYYGEYNSNLALLVNSPGVKFLRETNKKIVAELEVQYRNLLDDFFIQNNENNGIGLDRDGDDVHNLLPTIKQSWSSHGCNFGLVNGKFRLFFKYVTTGLFALFQGSEYVKKGAKYWNEMPWISDDYFGYLFWYIMFGAVEVNGNVWFAKCPIVNKQSGETFYLGPTVLTMCDNPVLRWFILAMSKVSLIHVEEDQFKQFESKPTSIFLGAKDFEDNMKMQFKASDMIYDDKNPHIKGRNRASTAAAYTKIEDLKNSERLDPTCPVDIYHVKAEYLRDPEQLLLYKLFKEQQTGLVLSNPTIEVNNTNTKVIRSSTRISTLQKVEELPEDPSAPVTKKQNGKTVPLTTDKKHLAPEVIDKKVDEDDLQRPDAYADFTVEKLKYLLDKDGIFYGKKWTKKQLLEA